MKRTFSEWGLIGSAFALVVSSVLWAGSYFTARELDYFNIETTGRPEGVIHLIIRRGEVWLSNLFNVDSSGLAQPLVFDPVVGMAKDDWAGRVVLPFFEAHYFSNSRNHAAIWSLRVSLWLPTALGMLGVAGFFYRIRRARRQAAAPGAAYLPA